MQSDILPPTNNAPVVGRRVKKKRKLATTPNFLMTTYKMIEVS